MPRVSACTLLTRSRLVHPSPSIGFGSACPAGYLCCSIASCRLRSRAPVHAIAAHHVPDGGTARPVITRRPFWRAGINRAGPPAGACSLGRSGRPRRDLGRSRPMKPGLICSHPRRRATTAPARLDSEALEPRVRWRWVKRTRVNQSLGSDPAAKEQRSRVDTLGTIDDSLSFRGNRDMSRWMLPIVFVFVSSSVVSFPFRPYARPCNLRLIKGSMIINVANFDYRTGDPPR